jgi:hypothetical protein
MYFNNKIRETVVSCRDDHHLNIVFVDVATGEDSFEGHEAYTDDPYINPLWLIVDENGVVNYREDYDQSRMYSCYSFHPNAKGLEVYRARFQEEINRLEKEKLAPKIEEANKFLNGYVSVMNHLDNVVFRHKCYSDGYFEGLLAVERLYDILHEEDPKRYPLECISKWDYDYWYYNLDAVQSVLDKLYGKSNVSPEYFFDGAGTVTSDGHLKFPVYGTDNFLTGECRYKIHSIETEGNEIRLNVSCIYIDCEYKEDWFNSWEVPVYGTYKVYDLLGEKWLTKGTDSKLKQREDYVAFADEFDTDGTNATTAVITLFRDEDGLHLK